MRPFLPRAPWPVVTIAVALVLAVTPRPAVIVEHVYARRLYPALQREATTASNLLPMAVIDVVIVAAACAVAWWLWTGVAVAYATRRAAPLAWAAGRIVTLAAAAYLWFVAVWGLNYGRLPIETRLGLPSGVPTEAEIAGLASQAVAELNAGHAAAHADRADDTALARALHSVELRHGRRGPTAVGRPKRSMLAWYFRAAGVDGLTAPALLETLLNPDLTDMERPFVLAHEWAHLSGEAPEADANFVGWLTTMASTAPRHRYSGWLFLVSETTRQLPRQSQRAVLAALAEGPRRDLDAIARRVAQRIDLVERVGWRVYDGYLRAQGVDDGLRSYSRVVELIVRSRRGETTREDVRR